VLATQNPIDLDYKALSNAGTWIIGKLQTDQDKQRLLDGLQSLESGLDRSYFDQTISALGKRVFLLHNIHAKAPVVFTTRWAMNYLAGPVTRNKLQDLNKLVGAGAEGRATSAGGTQPAESVSAEEIKSSAGANLPGTTVEPRLSSKVNVHYLPIKRSFSEAMKELGTSISGAAANPLVHYQPALIGQATVYFANRTYALDKQVKVAVCIPKLEGRGLVRWQDFLSDPIDPEDLESAPQPNATFGELVYPFDDERNLNELNKDFVEWIFRSQTMERCTPNDTLKLVSQPGESRDAFEERCQQASSGTSTEAAEKIRQKYAKLKKTIEDKKMREELELERDKDVLKQRAPKRQLKGLKLLPNCLRAGRAA